MAILSRVKISPQQRLDLEDFIAEQSASRTDTKLWTQKFLSESNLILSGFSVSGIGLSQATVNMSGASFILPENSTDFSYFVSSPSEPNVVIPAASLVDGSRNYIEAVLTTQDGTPLTKAFWDPEANSGLGQEFNQIVNTITDLKVSFVSSTGGFSGSVDRLPIAIIDCDGSGVIKVILDRRELFGRLAKPNNLDFGYAWGSKIEPTYSLSMTGVVGTFVAGETLTIGTETATVVTGGTTSITFNAPSGISFANGSSVTGGTSGATGTVDTIAESFSGVDKSISGQKNINDALMTEIRGIKGTRFWWQDASITLGGLEYFLNSVITPFSSAAKVSWNGSVLSITDSNGTPSSADVIAKIRVFGKSSQLNLARQDGTGGSSTIAIADGSVLYVQLPASGDRTFSGVGSGSTNYVVTPRASFVPSDTNFWLAFREGSKLFFRGNGELQTNESAEIGDNVPQTLLDNLGLVDEVTAPAYSSDIRGAASESLVSRIGTLTSAVGDEQEDRSGYLRSAATITWTGTQITFASDLVLDLVNTKSGTLSQHTVLAANSPLSLNDGESIYVSIDRTLASENLTPIRSSVTPIPAQTETNKDVIVLFRRVDASAVAYLHIPLHKQILEPNNVVRLGSTLPATISNRTVDNSNSVAVKDTQFEIQESADATVKLKALLSGATAGKTMTLASAHTLDRTLTLPDATDTLVGKATGDTLTNKILAFLQTNTANDGTSTGATATLAVPTTGVIRLTNASLTGIAGITAGGSAQFVVIENKTGGIISLQNESGSATATNRVLTGTGADTSLQDNSSVILVYDSTSGRWQLVGGASGSGTSSSESTLLQNLGISVTQATGTITVALKQFDGSTDPASGTGAVTVGFRSATATSGAYSLVSQTSALSLSLAGATTLGVASGAASYIYVYLINNAGTLLLGASLSQFGEGSLQATSTTATSNQVIYSSSAVSGKAIRLIGRFLATNTASSWGSPTEVSVQPLYLPQTVSLLATSSSTTSISTATWTQVAFGTVSDDPLNIFSTGTNLATIPSAGRYTIEAGAAFTASGTAHTNALALYKNGSFLRMLAMTDTSSDNKTMNGSFTDKFAAGDTLGIYVWQNSGGGLALAAPTLSSNQWLHYFSINKEGQ